MDRAHTIALLSESTAADAVAGGSAASSRHRYGFDARSVRGARLQKKLLDVALDLISAGNLRPSLTEITAAAGVRPNVINEQFGYLHLLLRQLVRERPVDVLVALRLPGDLPEAERLELAWMILTGCRPDRMGTLS